MGQVATLGPWAVNGPWGHNLKLTLDILELMKNKKKFLKFLTVFLNLLDILGWGSPTFFNFFKEGLLKNITKNRDVSKCLLNCYLSDPIFRSGKS